MEEKRYGTIVFIPGNGGGRYPSCNSLFIDDEMAVIIDPGSSGTRLASLRHRRSVDMIFNTHYHEDHRSYNYLFPDAALAVHKDETACFESLDTYLDYAGIAGTAIEDRWRAILIESFHYTERTPAWSLSDGDRFTFGSTTLQVVHTPGHTIGHCCFYFPNEEVLYLGDLDLTPFGPWYGDRVSDINHTIRSVNTILTIPARTFISSHETGIIEGDISEMARRYLAVIDRREDMLLSFLALPRTFDEIAGQWLIYKKPREPLEFYTFVERAHIWKHLDRLLHNGTVQYDNRLFYRC